MMEKKSDLKNIAIIGSGNVATHLFKALSGKDGIKVTLVNPHSPEILPERCDIALISVSDRAIAEVGEKISGKAEIIAHTSGSVPMNILNEIAPHYGVFYPLQTFTKGVEMKYSDIPFFIEGSDESASAALSKLAAMLSPTVIEADSARRKKLHIAAVFACNFANYLVDIADTLLHEDGLDYTVLLPLLRQTMGKLETTSPSEAQTGPAIRRDVPVIESHLSMLSNHPSLQKIYKLLSDEIMKK